ncbi:Ethylene-responsive transcription factor ERF114 family [Quillaja saponaria]|uniref:Ethylene-responsive transcription factor ERF114 family n=1 Tax=Quillaja saponaria TaxID=32244 RepID=A0AAD7QDW4_QUISA|nr:Ethylene-responsive transcription factor ERF114 family [Quillaja saponaria]
MEKGLFLLRKKEEKEDDYLFQIYSDQHQQDMSTMVVALSQVIGGSGSHQSNPDGHDQSSVTTSSQQSSSTENQLSQPVLEQDSIIKGSSWDNSTPSISSWEKDITPKFLSSCFPPIHKEVSEHTVFELTTTIRLTGILQEWYDLPVGLLSSGPGALFLGPPVIFLSWTSINLLTSRSIPVPLLQHMLLEVTSLN